MSFSKQKQNYGHREQGPVVAKGEGSWGRDGVGGWGLADESFSMDRQDPTVLHRELYSISCDKL